MHILEKDLKNKTIELEVEDTEDLWHLYNLIDIGDQLCGYTTRELRVSRRDGSEERCGRRRIYLCIEVEDLHFQSFTENLRVRGKILSCPEEVYSKGQYHTFSIKIGDIIRIIKREWLSFHEERLSLAEKKERQNAIIVTIDEEEAEIFLIKGNSILHMLSTSSNLPGKYLDEGKRSSERLSYLSNVAKEVIRLAEREKAKIIIGGPGFTKNDLYSLLKNMNVVLDVVLEDASSVGPSGVREIIKRGALSKIFKESLIIRDSKLIDELLLRLAKKPSMVAYGLDDVKKAIEKGAVMSLLISEKIFKSANPEQRLILEEMCKNVEKYGGKIYFIGSEHEKGIQLLNLGGIAALLRF
ncbi:MAG: mRNA surveillance protein pelota [Candidatus Methanomethyliaceae archaeon]|nr:mRNA surveillance protein pelota [Candidatus Methanomethyliaceae archaeon]MDW7971164.1 mRNA surveillance protein pelota [Nitrososphaerota archaeon]